MIREHLLFLQSVVDKSTPHLISKKFLKLNMVQTKKTKKQIKHSVKEVTPQVSKDIDEGNNKIDVEVEESDDSEESEDYESSDVELSEESDEEDNEEQENEEIKGLQDSRKHVIIKPSKKVDISKTKDKKGIIYLGRIPNEFEEPEMQKYFEQFGPITRLKLSRNKKSGKSKHYGFIEFSNKEVAKIASETMNNYLIFGHLLKCYLVEDSSKSDLIFSNSKFKIIPWKSISRHRNDKPKSLQHLEKLNHKFEQAKIKRAAKLNAKGINTNYLDN